VHNHLREGYEHYVTLLARPEAQARTTLRAKTLGSAGRLAWLPGARDDIAQLLRGMTVFVQPSLAEGASNTVLEAMASGLPVVATAVGGNPELVRNGWTGKLVPPRDTAQMAAAITDYYRIAGLAAQHGAHARRRVLNEFSMAAMAEAYLAVYDRLTSMKG